MAFGQDDDDEGYGKPVEEGKTYEVQIDDLGSKGDGIARVDGFVVFVPETDIGEKVEVEINSVGRRFAFGEVTDRLGMAEDGEAGDADEAAQESEALEEDGAAAETADELEEPTEDEDVAADDELDDVDEAVEEDDVVVDEELEADDDELELGLEEEPEV